MAENIVKGALLHDTGKLIMRATKEKISHSVVGKKYLSNKNFEKDIISCVEYHHAKDIAKADLADNSMAYIVYEADNISSAMDRRDNINPDGTDSEWRADIALKTIFSSFKQEKGTEDFYYPLRDLDPENKINYPVKEILASSDKYLKLKETLDKELNPNLEINSLLELLESTMSYVPSSTSTTQNADISLFDHSKTTAMVAECIYKYCEEKGITDYKSECYPNSDDTKKYYLLVSGDISGIQDFIYTISSKGALKSLRARSFYLDMILEHIVDEILTSVSCSRANLMYNGGGHFYMLLPNTDSVKSKLDFAGEKINEWFISEFGTDLYLALAYVEADKTDLKNTQNIFKNISLKLSKNKQARYTKAQLKTILKPQELVSEHECSICRTSVKTTTKRGNDLGQVCDTCYNLIEAGKNLINNNIVMSVTTDESEQSLHLPSLDNNKKFLNFKEIKDAVRYYVKNQRYTGKNYTTNLFVGDYNYRLKENEPADFSDLVSDSNGIKRLAAFRCDVDNLGRAFTSGFSTDYATISRTTSLSRQLSIFFKFYINKICEGSINGDTEATADNFYLNRVENKKKKLVIIYSGGDDVFVVGAWVDVINFAVDLRNAFRKFTCDKLTFSGGIGLFSPKYPVSQIASQSGKLEDFAKKYDNNKKDALALFGVDETSGECRHVYHWEDFTNEVVEKVKFFLDICKFENDKTDKDKVFFSTSMMYKFKQLLEESEKDKKINMARFAYTLARVVPKTDNNNKQKFRDNIYAWAINDKKSLLTALEIIIYLNRNEVRDD